MDVEILSKSYRISLVRSLFLKCAGWLLLGTVPLLGQVPSQAAKKTPSQKRTNMAHRRSAVKPNTPAPTPPPQPTAIAPMTPEHMPASRPRVLYQNGQLTVDSQNSTLSDILNAIRRQTGAQIDMPPSGGGERVAAHLSGPARQVIASLLDGSQLGYVIIGSAENPDGLKRVILTPQVNMPAQPAGSPRPGMPAGQQAFGGGSDMGDEGPTAEDMQDRYVMPPEEQQQPAGDSAGPVPPPTPTEEQPGQGNPSPNQPGQPNPGMQPQTPGQPQPYDPNQMGPQQPPNPNQSRVKTPEELLQELQRMQKNGEQNQ